MTKVRPPAPAKPAELEQRAQRAARQALDSFFRNLSQEPGPQARFRFFEAKVPGGASWRFAWTVERVRKGKRTGFEALAGKWSPWTSPLAPGQSWSSAREIPEAFQSTARRALEWTRSALFASRWRAKDRAWKWRCQKLGLPFESLHKRQELTPEQRAELAERLAAEKGGAR